MQFKTIITLQSNGKFISKEEVCQGMEGTVDLALFGSPPFILEYDLMAPNGHISTKKIQVATKYASLKLPNQIPGEYITTIKAIFDGNYGESDIHFREHQSELIIKQTVYPIQTSHLLMVVKPCVHVLLM